MPKDSYVFSLFVSGHIQLGWVEYDSPRYDAGPVFAMHERGPAA